MHGTQIQPHRKLHPNGAVAALLLSTFLASLAVSSVNVLLPSLMVELDATYTEVQWVVIGYMLSLTSILVIAGRLSDLYGRRPLFIIGMVVFIAGSVLCGTATTIEWLSTFRLLQGAGAAILISVNLALISEIVPKGKAGAAIGLVGSMSAVGTATGPVLGGWMAEVIGWQSIFLLNVPLGLLALFIGMACIHTLRGIEDRNIKRFDFIGSISLATLTICYALGVKLFAENSASIAVALICLSIMISIVFVASQRRSRSPLISMAALRDRELFVFILFNFAVSMVVMTAFVIGPFYLMNGLGLSLPQTGLVMAVSPVIVASVSFIVGRSLSERNTRAIITTGLVALLIGALGLALLDRSSSVSGYLICLVFTALGYGTFTASHNTFLMLSASPDERGAVSGLVSFSRNLGLLSGAAIMSTLFELFTGASQHEQLPPEFAEIGLNRVYTVIALVLSTAIFVQRRAKSRNEANIN